MSMIWHNGEFKPQGTGIFTARDRMRLGDGYFDTMLAVGGELLHADLHYRRLFETGEALVMNVPLSFTEFESAVKDLLMRNGYLSGHYAINTIITRGEGQRGIMPPDVGDQNPNIVIMASKAPESFPPIEAITSQRTKRNEHSPLSQLKTLNYGDHVLAMIEAKDAGVNEALMMNTAGRAACFTAGNIFIQLDGKLMTPPLSEGALNGVTRQVFMAQYDVTEEPITPPMLEQASTIFMTNSIRGAVFVQRLDNRVFKHADLQIDKDFHLKSNFKVQVNER